MRRRVTPVCRVMGDASWQEPVRFAFAQELRPGTLQSMTDARAEVGGVVKRFYLDV
jgi:hypothetical protein